MSSVLPGVDDVLASLRLFVSMLMRLDLPTFDLPMKAYSGFVSLGHIDTIGAESVNSACLISMLQRYEKFLEMLKKQAHKTLLIFNALKFHAPRHRILCPAVVKNIARFTKSGNQICNRQQ